MPGTQPPGVREQDFLTGTSRTFLAPDIKDYSWLFEKGYSEFRTPSHGGH